MPTSAASGRLLSRPRADAGPADDPASLTMDGIGLPGTLLLVPEGVRAPAPLVVFFHGAGGEASRSAPLVRDTAQAHGVLALLPTSAGTTWDLLSGGLGRDGAALDAALGRVFERFAVSGVCFAGFSDGASYALSLGLANGDLAEAVLAFSPGFVAPPTQAGRPRLWVTHGRADTVLPVDRCGRKVASLLRSAGYELEYVEVDGGHVVRPQAVREAFAWWLGPA